ncbi:unnamed protein product [Clonostachys chloroleuca]|uniref:Aldehyde dehydrogenase domain-containing protein n=1 Tax=Clonostachys chloroleuca TaxID=1926264 RepID=A0AA35LY39_9HYPO|nr:unnamed protein product [Clonostachys chloroleuca]
MASNNGAHSNGADATLIPPKGAFIPLLINGADVKHSDTSRHWTLDNGDSNAGPSATFQGADAATALQAIEGSQKAFETWSQTRVGERRIMFQKLVEGIRNNQEAIGQMIKEEIHCDDHWITIQLVVGVSVIEEAAAAMSSEAAAGQILHSMVPGAYPLVIQEPYGVILGMAPWNAPLILGLRSIVGALAAGNTVIFRGSELSPRTHRFIANLIRWAGFPPGVCNFLLHRPEDAVEVFETCISHPSVKKANFTGSTAVGRSIAVTAAKYLKPVLLELGGKNISIVLEDADIEKAAEESWDHAMINNGQVCMATDTILVHDAIIKDFTTAIRKHLDRPSSLNYRVITDKARQRIIQTLEEITATGAKVTTTTGEHPAIPAALIEDVPADSKHHRTEFFGPLLAVQPISSEDDSVRLVHATNHGLSCSIFSRDTLRAVNLGRRLDVGAVHINAGSVHDEGNFPHGGTTNSGYGRFGGTWAVREFTKPKMMMIYQ